MRQQKNTIDAWVKNVDVLINYFLLKNTTKMAQKPLLPNWFLIQGETIKNRVSRVLNTEIYGLQSWLFLYIITDVQIMDVPNDKIKKNKLFPVRVWYNQFIWFIWKEYWIENLEKLKKKLITSIWFDSIAWMHELKELFTKEIIDPLRNPEKYKKYKLPIPNGVLFFGPPGCWKTFLSRKLAEEIWYNFYEIKHSDLATPYIHWSTSKIWEVFAMAKENRPSIIFFDEISWIVPKRENLDSSSQFREEEVNEFLMHLNDASKNQILVIWATNFPDRIDTAIMRSWRMDKRIFIWAPDYQARIELFEMYLKDRPLENIDFAKLAELTWWEDIEETYIGFNTWTTKKTFSERFVSSDIQVMCDEFARKALREDSFITMDICEKVIKHFTPSISPDQLQYYRSEIEQFQRF